VHNILVGWTGTKGPGLVGEEGVLFGSHGSNPFGLRCCLSVSGWFRGKRGTDVAEDGSHGG
jgi:hypothetical protein